MIDLPPIVARINALLAEGTDASVTYAALEARLAIEKVCYDRLRQSHDYISHAQLKKWQPGAVVNTLINEVDQHAATTLTLSVSRTPFVEGVDPKDQDYVEVGTQVGFDPKPIGKMWNALAKLALHVRLPEHKDDHIPPYGDRDAIRAKVMEVVVELERLSAATMLTSGIGEEVSFICRCGSKNKRRAGLLKEGQAISCINPDCLASWIAHKTGDDFTFEAQTGNVPCEKCAAHNLLPWRALAAMKYGARGSFNCHACDHMNYFEWRLMQVRPEPAPLPDQTEPPPTS